MCSIGAVLANIFEKRCLWEKRQIRCSFLCFNAIKNKWSDFLTLLDTNECDGSPCGPHSFCVNTDGSYRCDCLQGFTETHGLCLGRYIIYISYLDKGNFVWYSAVKRVTNSVNSKLTYVFADAYWSVVQKYFTFIIVTFIDVDECFGNVCMEDATCTNTEGSYECTCNAGFRQIQNLCIGKITFVTFFRFLCIFKGMRTVNQGTIFVYESAQFQVFNFIWMYRLKFTRPSYAVFPSWNMSVFHWVLLSESFM